MSLGGGPEAPGTTPAPAGLESPPPVTAGSDISYKGEKSFSLIIEFPPPHVSGGGATRGGGPLEIPLIASNVKG